MCSAPVSDVGTFAYSIHLCHIWFIHIYIFILTFIIALLLISVQFLHGCLICAYQYWCVIVVYSQYSTIDIINTFKLNSYCAFQFDVFLFDTSSPRLLCVPRLNVCRIFSLLICDWAHLGPFLLSAEFTGIVLWIQGVKWARVIVKIFIEHNANSRKQVKWHTYQQYSLLLLVVLFFYMSCASDKQTERKLNGQI